MDIKELNYLIERWEWIDKNWNYDKQPIDNYNKMNQIFEDLKDNVQFQKFLEHPIILFITKNLDIDNIFTEDLSQIILKKLYNLLDNQQ